MLAMENTAAFPVWLTPREVARGLGLSPQKVYQLARDGELPAAHVGRSVRIPADELEAWARGRVTKAKPENGR